MNQLCLGWTKTPRAAHSAAHASVNWWSVSPANDKYGMVTRPVPGRTSGRCEGPPPRSVGGRFARKVKDSW